MRTFRRAAWAPGPESLGLRPPARRDGPPGVDRHRGMAAGVDGRRPRHHLCRHRGRHVAAFAPTAAARPSSSPPRPHRRFQSPSRRTASTWPITRNMTSRPTSGFFPSIRLDRRGSSSRGRRRRRFRYSHRTATGSLTRPTSRGRPALRPAVSRRRCEVAGLEHRHTRRACLVARRNEAVLPEWGRLDADGGADLQRDQQLDVGRATRLFDLSAEDYPEVAFWGGLTLSPDGRGFAIVKNLPRAQRDQPRLVLVTDWLEATRRGTSQLSR